MSRILPSEVSEWTDEDKAYARDREWLIPEGADLGDDGELTPESVRKMTKGKLEKLVEEDTTGLLSGVDTSQTKAELAEAIVDAMWESTE